MWVASLTFRRERETERGIPRVPQIRLQSLWIFRSSCWVVLFTTSCTLSLTSLRKVASGQSPNGNLANRTVDIIATFVAVCKYKETTVNGNDFKFWYASYDSSWDKLYFPFIHRVLNFNIHCKHLCTHHLVYLQHVHGSCLAWQGSLRSQMMCEYNQQV